MKFKKAVGKIHLWLGLASGLIVFIVSITGCLYVFEKELKEVFYRERLTIDVEDNSVRLPTSISVNNAEALFDHTIQAYSLVTSTHPNETLQVHFFKRRGIEETGMWTWYGEEQQYYYIAYMDPYSGQLVRLENTKWEFFTVVEAIHTSLLLGPIGNRIIAVSVLIFLILLITGILLWWPRTGKAWKMRTWFQWKSTTKWKRKNYDLHNIPGFYVLFLAFVVAITGLSWSFDWINQSVQWIANGGDEKESGYKSVQSDSKKSTEPDPVDRIMTDLRISYPHATKFHFFYPRDTLGTYSAFADYGSSTRWSVLSYDQYSVKKLDEYSLSDLNNGEAIEWLNYDIHTGTILGFPGKLLAFFASLISASLPVTGFLIWWGRRRKEKQQPKRKKYPKLTLVPDRQEHLKENGGVVSLKTDKDPIDPIEN
ncbi:MAG: PepSY-associated TM helix domain-containing protein [Bacteroidota bacterium]